MIALYIKKNDALSRRCATCDHMWPSVISYDRNIHLKIHNVAADAGVCYRKIKKMQKIFVDRVCENLIREVWQKRNLRVKCTKVVYPYIKLIHSLTSD